MAKPEELQHGARPDSKRPLVFLDTSVIIGYLQGDPSAAKLFSPEATGRIRFAVNAIVLQELLLAADAAGRPEFEQIRDHLRVLPVDFCQGRSIAPTSTGPEKSSGSLERPSYSQQRRPM